MRAHQLVRIRVVRDDVAVAGNRDRIDRVGRNADSAGEFDRAVLVRVFQANVEDRWFVAAVQALFQLFFADAFDGHGAILAVRG